MCTRLFDSSNFALATRTCALILITFNLTLNRLLGSDCMSVVVVVIFVAGAASAVAFFIYLFDMNARLPLSFTAFVSLTSFRVCFFIIMNPGFE